MIFGNFLEILGCTRFFWGQKRTIHNLIYTLFFHRCLDNIPERHLNLKKVGLRGKGILPLNLNFFNKIANFTKKKLSYPNYCYLSFEALDMGAHTVLDFWDYLN